MRPKLLALLLLLFAAPACSKAAPAPPAALPTVGGPVRPRGGRTLAIGANPGADHDGAEALGLAIGAGAEDIPEVLFWDATETAPGTFHFNPGWLQAVNTSYPRKNLRVLLTIPVLDTLADRRPKDLQGKPYDAPEVIARFNAFLDALARQAPHMPLAALAIGNEVDGVLASNPKNWEAYTRFFRQVAAHAHTLWPNVPVGVKIMFKSARETPALIRPLWEAGDAVMLTYYPLNTGFQVQPPEVVAKDFAEMVQIARGKPVFLLETGYPSGAACGSSAAAQAAFIHQLFRAWDRHAASIPLISFVFLTDLSPETVQRLEGYYGLKHKAFAEYLRTLGLRTWEGKDKPAFLTLKAEAAARGWPVR